MKKWFAGILAAGMVCLMGTAAFAAGPGRYPAGGEGACGRHAAGWHCRGDYAGCGYVDADGDGVCDNWDGVCAGGRHCRGGFCR